METEERIFQVQGWWGKAQRQEDKCGKSGWMLGALGACGESQEKGPEQLSSVWAGLGLQAQGLGCRIAGSMSH